MAFFKKSSSNNKSDNPFKEIRVWMDDKDVLQILRQWSQKGDDFKKSLEVDWKRNLKYFIWKYDRDLQQLPVWRANAVDNRIFAAVKSVTPFVTSRPAQPVCYSKKEWEDETKIEESKFISNCTQDVLKKMYTDSQIQKLNEQNCINRYLYKIGLLRSWIWADWKIFTRLVDPKEIIFDEWARQFKDSKYIWEPVRYTAQELIAMFPDKEKEIKKEITWKPYARIDCIEWWTETAVCVTIDTRVLLQLKENPFINKGNDILNYYDIAPIPYVAYNVYNLGERILDDVTEIDLTITMQDSVNDITRAMIDNVKYCWNPIKVAYWLSDMQTSLIANTEPWDAVILWKDQDLKYLQATWMPTFAENVLANLKNEIDAIFWTQATFRGEFEWIQSWISRDILRQQSANSLAQISRWIERMMDDLYKLWLHFIMVYADDPDFVKVQLKPILWDRTDKYVEYLFNAEDGIEVSVLPGTILPDDPVTKSEQAMELAWMNRITTQLLYEQIWISNADEEADKFDLNQTTIELKSQALQQKTQQQQAETATMRWEFDNINKTIDSMWWEPSADQQTPAIPTTNPAAWVNISIGNKPENPVDNTSWILSQIAKL